MKIIVVDYINFGLLPSLLRLEDGSKVFFLFKPQILLIERCISYILKFKNITTHFVRLNSAKSYRFQSDVCDTIASKVVVDLKEVGIFESYYKQRVGDFIYENVYRSISIIEFIKSNSELMGFNQVFLSKNNFSQIILREYPKLEITFYRNFGHMLDDTYQSFYSPNQNVYHKNTLKGLLKVINSMINVSLLSWPKLLTVNLISIIHPNNKFRRALSQSEITGGVANNAVFHNNFLIEQNEKKYKIRRLNRSNIMEFLLHIRQSFRVCFPAPLITIGNKLTILSECIDLFFLMKMIDKLRCKAVYSVYESNNALLLLHAATISNSCISLASSFSAGYFPAQYHISHRAKNVDVYLLWGELLSNLYIESGDQSKFHIITGYTGSHYLDNFFKESKVFFEDDKSPVVSIYDTSVYDDLFVNKEEMLSFVCQISEYALARGVNVIIKTKRHNELYSNLIKKYPNSIAISDQLSSLSAGMRSNLVVGYLMSTPVLLLGSYKRNVVFFDPYKICWDKYYDCFSDCIEREMKGIFSRIKEVATDKRVNASNSDCSEFQLVNRFNDANYQKKVSEYINSILKSKHEDKKLVLLESNISYQKKYGLDLIKEKDGY